MRVLIIAANRIHQPVTVIPFGACMVAQAAKSAGHDVRLLDLMFERNFKKSIQRTIKNWRPDVVGLSIRNIDTNDLQNPVVLADEAAEITAVIKQNTAAPVVLGGAAMGVMPREMLAHTHADLAVLYDGETVFPKVIEAFSRGEDVRGMPGVLVPGEKNLPARPASNGSLKNCAVADLAGWIDVRKYLGQMTSIPIQTKRGCPFQCVYCTYSMAEGHDYRLLPPQQVVEEIQRLATQGLRDLEFVDNVFNSPYEHALEICGRLAAARPRVRLQTLEINPRFLDDQLLSAMEAAGFVGIGITAESASDPALDGLKKGYTAAQVRSAAAVVARHKIPCIWIFMLGGPGETQATVQETIQFALQEVRPSDTAFFQIGTRVYPGTELEMIARREGRSPPRPIKCFIRSFT